MENNQSYIIDLHTHLETLSPIVSFRNKIQGHIYSLGDHLHKDKKVILSVAMYVQVWSGYSHLKKMTEKFIAMVNSYGEEVKLIKTKEDLKANYKVGIILHVESARCLKNYEEQLPELFNLGIRGIIPIHFKDNRFGNSNDDPFRRIGIKSKDTGLTDDGKMFVEICNNLGIWLDLSHTADKTGQEILELANEVMVSHVGIRDLVNRKRNKDLTFLQSISDKNGIFGLTPWCHLVGNEEKDFIKQLNFSKENNLSKSACIGTDLGAPIKTSSKIRSIFDIARLTQDEDFIYKNAYSFFERVLP